MNDAELGVRLFNTVLLLVSNSLFWAILLTFAVGALCFLKRKVVYNYLRPACDGLAVQFDELPSSTRQVYVVMAAALCLFAELLIIRVHSSYFQLFGYYKNVSLLSCFLGLGVGYALARGKNFVAMLGVPALCYEILALHLLRYSELSRLLNNPSWEYVAFGFPLINTMPLLTRVYSYFFLVFVFVGNALVFLPFGQLTGRLMVNANKLHAYSFNLIGSLAGIVLFSILAFLWTPPLLWLIALVTGSLIFFYRSTTALLVTAIPTLIVVAVLSFPLKTNEFDLYSPYQVIGLRLNHKASPELRVNNVYFQHILNLNPNQRFVDDGYVLRARHYDAPYRWKPKPESVLIVGSGTGNDVAAALRAEAQHIDAVEIDPLILHLGRQLHPERPYDSAQVKVHVEDARTFIKYTENKYDVISYGLLDSHTLLASSVSVRLDSFVYTIEAFREARARLKADGLLCISFAYFDGMMAKKMSLMLQSAFDGRPPIALQSGYNGSIILCAGDFFSSSISIQHPDLYPLNSIYQAFPEEVDLSTDDWPFLYMVKRCYPYSYLIMTLALALTSFIFLRSYCPDLKQSISWPCFFLGAGFMLVEAKSITELALIFGSTWLMVSLVVGALLLMAFLGNAVVAKWGPVSRLYSAAFLITSLAAGLCWYHLLVAQSGASIFFILLAIALLTLPFFFSGIAFSSELLRTSSVASALSSNLLGSMAGGLIEYNALFTGYSFLYLVAILLYLLALLPRYR